MMASDDPATTVVPSMTNGMSVQTLNLVDIEDVGPGTPDEISGEAQITGGRSFVRTLVEASRRVRLVNPEDLRHVPRGPPRPTVDTGQRSRPVCLPSPRIPGESSI